jgi:RHS repeat-associated protein
MVTTTLPSGNGHVEERTYDQAGRLTRVKHAKGQTTLADFTYTLDPVANPTQVARTGLLSETQAYEYDEQDRLTEVCFQSSCPNQNDPFIRWTYDDVGNRLTEQRSSGTTSYTYNAANELTQAGSTTFDYDQNGNQTEAGSTTYSYDLANRLASADDGSTITEYEYNGDGNRLEAVTGSATVEYLWDTNNRLPQLAREQDGSGTLIRRYVYGTSRISMSTGGSTYYYHRDLIGSVANLTDSSGASQWTYAYEPFGSTRIETEDVTSPPPNPIRFAGEYRDPTGLYNLRARLYEPSFGRLLQPDPLSPGLSAPSASPFVYAADAPTFLVDPSGMAFEAPNPARDGCAELTGPILDKQVVEEATVPTCTRSYVRSDAGSYAPIFEVEMSVKNSDTTAIQYSFEYRYKKRYRLDAKETFAWAQGTRRDGTVGQLAYNSSNDRGRRRSSQIKPWYAHFTFWTMRNTILIIYAETHFVAPIPVVTATGRTRWAGDRYNYRCRVPAARN